MTEETPIILDYYVFSVALLKRLAGSPRNFRHGLSRSMERRAEELLSLLILAKYDPRGDRDAILRDVNVGLEVLRFQIRQAVDLKALALSSQKTLLVSLISIGQQVGGWRRSLQRQPPTP